MLFQLISFPRCKFQAIDRLCWLSWPWEAFHHEASTVTGFCQSIFLLWNIEKLGGGDFGDFGDFGKLANQGDRILRWWSENLVDVVLSIRPCQMPMPWPVVQCFLDLEFLALFVAIKLCRSMLRQMQISHVTHCDTVMQNVICLWKDVPLFRVFLVRLKSKFRSQNFVWVRNPQWFLAVPLPLHGCRLRSSQLEIQNQQKFTELPCARGNLQFHCDSHRFLNFDIR